MTDEQYSTPIYVVIVAGGQGTRMGMALPKQFLPLLGKPILYHTIAAFIKAIPLAHLVLVLPEPDISKLQMVLEHFAERVDLTIVPGGKTRYESVQNGLKGLPLDSIILVHDGVRPFITDALIQRCVHSAQQYGSAIPALQVVDSIRIFEDDDQSRPIDRSKLRIIQTPQAFQGALLLPAFEQEYRLEFTDEATVVESMQQRIRLVEGDRNNIKITTPEDMVLAESIILRKNL